MTEARLERSHANLGAALSRLEEPLGANRLVLDGTIRRFEFAIELFWKTLKHLLAAEGVETATPKSALRAAFQAAWLDDEALWLGMLADRNRTSHLYDEAAARAIHQRIGGYATAMRTAHGLIGGRIAGR